MKRRILLSCIILACASAAIAESEIDTLERQPEWGNLYRNAPVSAFAGVPPGSNFDAAMRDPSKMLSWIQNTLPGFTKLESTYFGTEHGVAAKRTYETGKKSVFKENDSRRSYTVTIIVPWPRHKISLEAGMVKEIARFKPPMLKVESTEPVNINGLPANLYFQRDGNCSLVMDIARNGVVNIEGQTCEFAKELIELAKALDIKRLQDKLET